MKIKVIMYSEQMRKGWLFSFEWLLGGISTRKIWSLTHTHTHTLAHRKPFTKKAVGSTCYWQLIMHILLGSCRSFDCKV